MKRFLVLVFLAGCCAHHSGGTSNGSGSGTTTTTDTLVPGCACDCPDGPPAPPAIDTFCAADWHDQQPCCFGTGSGVCHNHECVP